MSDNNHNITTNKAIGEQQSLAGANTKLLTYTCSSTTSTSSASYIDITGMSDASYTVPADGTYLVMLSIPLAQTSSAARSQFAIRVDNTTDHDTYHQLQSTSGVIRTVTTSALITLTAGVHNFRPRIKKTGNTGNVSITTGFVATIMFL